MDEIHLSCFTAEDREAERRIVELARREIKAGRTVPIKAVDRWMAEWAEGLETPFPNPSKET